MLKMPAINTTWPDELHDWLKKQAGVTEKDSIYMSSRRINEFLRTTMNMIKNGTIVLSSTNSPFTIKGKIDNWPTLQELQSQGKAGEKTSVKTMYIKVDMKDLLTELKEKITEMGLTEPKEEKVAPPPPPPPPNDTLDLLDNIKFVRAMEKMREEEDVERRNKTKSVI